MQDEAVLCSTSARFVAILDKQSKQEAEESLARYHKRVSALIEKHRAEGYAKVCITSSVSGLLR